MKLEISKFNSLQAAQRWINNSPMTLVLFHGDDDLYWVVRGRDCSKLESLGYERF